MGGINLYQYAPNPVEWVDPWGWSASLSGELAEIAKEVHNLTKDLRAKANSTIAIARVRIDGKSQLFAAKNGGKGLSVAQQMKLIELGVPKENIFNGVQYGRSFDKLDNHAERIIIRNLPEDAEIEGWGISWGGRQRNLPCDKCEPLVFPED